jgi:Predicted sugar kinase
MPAYEKIIVLTKPTALQELSERMGTKAQARFYLAQEAARIGDARLAPSYEEYERADAAYQRALERVKAALPRGVRVQYLDSGFLPQFTFGERDLVLALGPDGLVVNAAKYLDGQPVVAVNPDPERIEGVLLPFRVEQAGAALARVLEGRAAVRALTMAEARLADGQTLRAVNDLFIGRATHASARYRLSFGGVTEEQSSSGVIVSTGTGSTGWLRSVVAGAAGMVAALGGEPGHLLAPDACRFDPSADELVFSVREPWASRTTGATLVHGRIGPGAVLEIVSQMADGGVIFSDGVEADYLPFSGGAVARIGLSERKVALVTA